MGDLSLNFSRSEFACKDSCGLDDINPGLVSLLQDIRDVVGPMKINSGCRCPKHNRDIGGKDNSAHLRGMAADIACVDSRSRYELLAMIPSRFHRYEICKSWIHVDVDPSLPQDVAILG